ncbi:tRNA/rRNA cytosine-C5-methylase, NOL1/NOP2/Sun family [Campylobacter iguaniorum]|uniref:tRNA/rRNA cytosine-C5-methylase, NOL1/NOP2/Sun family n=1 Tax=Campylobacter iguaniorum TaxID=1244531 RepID=A0A076FC48_9BACT|nr:RsmB/NOP family class I SAM-dependent RNA methyltransferase [Campylobacter iguaniorum]AII15002.1 tRNA/rRNA cytosine-C5-methylase, NOL1/NOP2/Sun family [Campylobacter iguaniorum]
MSFRDDLATLVPKDKFDSVWNSFFEPKFVGFFINLLASEPKSVESELESLGVEFKQFNLPNFYICEPKFKEILSHSSLFNEGKIYIQNPSSYLSPLMLNPLPSDITLDMCASPGGKSIVLANLMGGAKNLAVMEANKDRFFTLKMNLKKYGCNKAKTFNKDARSVSHTCANRFDKILLDAPCSSYSQFGVSFKEKSYKEIKSIAKLQKQLLNSALTALKVGGSVVYSTCTFYEEENEEVIQNALNSKFELKLEPLNLGLKQAVSSEFGVRIIPDETMDAFFVSKIVKLA